jgi:hypothetical protein
MRKVVTLLLVIVSAHASSQDKELKEKLNSFFFNLSFYSDIDVIRAELGSNENFKPYHDPNRDNKKTIIGTIKADSNLNPICSGNQVIIQYSTAEPKKTKKVSFKWTMNYRLEDLAHANIDFEKLKSDFSPFFPDVTESKKTGAQREQVWAITMTDNSITVVITFIQYHNFSHSVSVLYQDKWKIAPTQILKVKY